MSRRSRALAATLVAAVHLAIFVPVADNVSVALDEQYRSVAEATLDGARPYAEFNFEYPPFSLLLALGPAAVTDDEPSFSEVFSWEMIAFDLAIVIMLAFGISAPSRRVWAALAAYSIGLVFLHFRVRSGLGFGALALHRVDLPPAALVLGAALARRAGRSATWGALLGAGTAIKAFPAAVFPALAMGERRLGRTAVAALVPLVAAAALVLALGDQFWSAITYHTDRDLQIETVGASLLLAGHVLGAEVTPVGGAGSWNLDGTAADLIRLVTIGVMLACYAFVVRQVWVRRIGPLEAAALVLAPLVVLAPVLSPQFLIWLLPVSAAVYGLRAPNLVLVAACFLSGITLGNYNGVFDLEPDFVFPILARNILLLAYLWMVLAPVLRRAPVPARRPRPAAAV